MVFFGLHLRLRFVSLRFCLAHQREIIYARFYSTILFAFIVPDRSYKETVLSVNPGRLCYNYTERVREIPRREEKTKNEERRGVGLNGRKIYMNNS